MKKEIKIMRSNPIKTFALLLISVFFVVIGAYLIDDNPFIAWLTIIFFGLGVFVFLVQLIPSSSHLKLSNDGFEVKSLFKSNFTKWSDVEGFRVGYVGGNTMVMYDFCKEHKKHKIGKKLSQFLSGSEAALPTTYGMKAVSLSELMNDWKTRNKNLG